MVAATVCAYMFIYMCVYAIKKKKNKHFAHTAALMFVTHFMRLYDLAGVETPRANSKPMDSLIFLQDYDFSFANSRIYVH